MKNDPIDILIGMFLVAFGLMLCVKSWGNVNEGVNVFYGAVMALLGFFWVFGRLILIMRDREDKEL